MAILCMFEKENKIYSLKINYQFLSQIRVFSVVGLRNFFLQIFIFQLISPVLCYFICYYYFYSSFFFPFFHTYNFVCWFFNSMHLLCKYVNKSRFETWYVDRTSYGVMHIGRKFWSPQFRWSYIPWKLENTYKRTCHCNSSETTVPIIMVLCILAGNFDPLIFVGVMPLGS